MSLLKENTVPSLVTAPLETLTKSGKVYVVPLPGLVHWALIVRPNVKSKAESSSFFISIGIYDYDRFNNSESGHSHFLCI
jgi:hypothetical protein